MRRALALVALCAAAAAAAAEPPVRVVASLYPLALLVRELGGERAVVDVLVPPGASPHTFEPVPGDLARVAGADLFVSVGGGLDDWTREFLAAAPPSLARVTLADVVAASPAGASPGAVEGGPHVWLDPLLVRDAIAPALTRALAERDPAGAERYRALARDFERRLTALDAELREILSAAPRREYVAFHAAWRYFAGRYGLREVAVVEAFPGEEPTPRRLAELVDAARRAGVRAILVEPQLHPRVASVLAAEFGGVTVTVDPLGTPDDPERARYEDLMRFDARAFAAALGATR